MPPDQSPVISTLSDAQGSFSSRRVGAFVALACLVFAFIIVIGCFVAAFTAGIGHPIPDSITSLMNTLLGIMAAAFIGGLGLATADRWAPK